MLKRVGKTVLWIVLIALGAGLIWLANLIWFRPFSINHFYEKVFIEFMLKNPELLSSIRILEPMGIDFHNDDLTDVSDKAQKESNALFKKDLEVLRAYDRKSQTPSQLLSTDILDWFLEDRVRAIEFLYYDYPVNQLSGVQNELPTFMATIHVIDNKNDAENYITRLSKFDTKFDQILEGLKIREQRKIIPPQFVIQKVLTEMRGFIAQPIRENILFVSFEKNVKKLQKLSSKDQQNLLSAAEREIRDTVYPAYKKLIAYFEYLEPIATTDDGVWKFPDGDRFYQYSLRSYTTTNLSAEEIHQLGISEVARIQKEIQTILAREGYKEKSPGEYMTEFGKEERFLYPDTDEGKKQCLVDYQSMIDEIDRGLSSTFDIRPKIGVKVERIPEFKEKTSAGAYYIPPSLDGKRPGIFYANLRNMNEIVKWQMRTLAYHEAIPGHHFQQAVAELVEGPTFRKLIPFTAYNEGWALYAERLAWELGYEKDPYDDLGRLQAEMFRAVRLVVDTGIHRKRWTREQAIEYMKQNTGMPEGEVIAEIERYIVLPGQACAYKVGQLKILQLREKAKNQMGSRFDIRKFHNVVLQNGAMPLEILERQVGQYIK